MLYIVLWRPQSPVPHVRVAVSLEIIWDQSSDQNIVDCSALVSYCCMTTSDHTRPVWQQRHIRVSSSSTVLAWLRSLWLPYPSATQGGSWWKDFTIGCRSAGGGEWVVKHAAKRFFLQGIQELWSAEGYVLSGMGLPWRMTKLYRTYSHYVT
jgi:hypothetical protein